MKKSQKIITARQPCACNEQPLTGLDAGMPVDSFCIALVYSQPLDELTLIDGLQKALDENPYFSGRIFGIGSTLPLVIPNNEGALFTCNTFAGCIPTFDIDQPLKPHLRKFGHHIEGAGFDHHTPLLQIQLTNFSDGSVLSISISHALCDGTSMIEFMQSWAGHTLRKNPRPRSAWNRRDVQQMALGDGITASPLTPVIELRQLPPLWQSVETLLLRLPGTLLEQLYDVYGPVNTTSGTSHSNFPQKQTYGQDVSRLDIAAAFLYLLLLRCKNDRQSPHSLSIVCNVRQILELPAAYLGNAVSLRYFELDDEQLMEADIRSVAQRIRDLYREITASDLRRDIAFWQRKIADGTSAHFMPVATYLALTGGILLDNMSRFAFYELDFGVGKPTWIDTPAPSSPAYVTRGVLMLPAPPSHAGIDLHVSLPPNEMTVLRKLLKEAVRTLDQQMEYT